MAHVPHGGVLWKVERAQTHSLSAYLHTAPAPDGGVYVAGEIGHADSDDARSFVSRVGPGKRVVWSRRVGSWGRDSTFVWSCAGDGGGNVIVSGMRERGSRTWLFVGKYDRHGRQRWLRSVSPPGCAVVLSTGPATVGPGGHVYVAVTGLTRGGPEVGTVVAFAAGTGRMLWSTRIVAKAKNGSNCYDVAVDPAGNLYAVGVKNGEGSRQHICVCKLTADGRRVWTRSWPAGRSMCDPQSRVVFAGSRAFAAVSLATANKEHLRLVSVRGSGADAWSRSLDIHGQEAELGGVVADAAGNVYVAGQTAVKGPEQVRAFLQRWSPAGRRAWVRTYYNVKARQPAMFLGVAIRGRSLYCTGSRLRAQDAPTMLTVRVTTDGRTAWRQVWTGGGKRDAMAWAVHPQRNGVYVAGASMPLDQTVFTSARATVWKLRP
ncbi:MAG: hypothetical protein FJ000_05905 [Actinobacteria bacterium]|nr:hypothetical protein [Actinomycetota bacterium]